MAGRGCTIVIKLLGGSLGNSETEDISLPVALHSPLQVLKEQLSSLVQISIADQVLILCDLNDLERNSDKLLSGSEFLSLRDCGIRNGSILTLHALGMSAEKKQTMARDALSNKTVLVESKEKVYTLETETTAAEANHSYNGIIFDVSSNGPFEIDILSVSVAGMLGRVRIYARDRPWEENDGTPQAQNQHWWAHRESLSKDHWVQVADVRCRPAWDKPVEIKFTRKVTLLPHARRALYCHSSLPDDLGIQYQSYAAKSVFADDEFVTLHAGLGHTGSVPFDDTNGWYRGGRGLAGAVRYNMRYKGWTVFEHYKFPRPLKEAVRTMLLCQNRDIQTTNDNEKTADSSSSSRSHPKCSSSSSSKSPSFFSRSRSGSSDSQGSNSAVSTLRQLVSSVPSPSSLFRSSRLATRDSLDKLMHASSSPSGAASCPGDLVLRLRRLHVHLVYNILEFMHWDWFEECTPRAISMDEEDEDGPLRYGKKKTPEARQNYINNYLMTLLAGHPQGLVHLLPGHHHPGAVFEADHEDQGEIDFEDYYGEEEDDDDEDYEMDAEDDDEDAQYETGSDGDEDEEEDEGAEFVQTIRSHTSGAVTASDADTASLAASLAAFAARTSSTSSSSTAAAGAAVRSPHRLFDGVLELSSEEEEEEEVEEVEESEYETVSDGEEDK